MVKSWCSCSLDLHHRTRLLVLAAAFSIFAVAAGGQLGSLRGEQRLCGSRGGPVLRAVDVWHSRLPRSLLWAPHLSLGVRCCALLTMVASSTLAVGRPRRSASPRASAAAPPAGVVGATHDDELLRVEQLDAEIVRRVGGDNCQQHLGHWPAFSIATWLRYQCEPESGLGCINRGVSLDDALGLPRPGGQVVLHQRSRTRGRQRTPRGAPAACAVASLPQQLTPASWLRPHYAPGRSSSRPAFHQSQQCHYSAACSPWLGGRDCGSGRTVGADGKLRRGGCRRGN